MVAKYLDFPIPKIWFFELPVLDDLAWAGSSLASKEKTGSKRGSREAMNLAAKLDKENIWVHSCYLDGSKLAGIAIAIPKLLPGVKIKTAHSTPAFDVVDLV